jgi:hypothetical protein
MAAKFGIETTGGKNTKDRNEIHETHRRIQLIGPKKKYFKTLHGPNQKESRTPQYKQNSEDCVRSMKNIRHPKQPYYRPVRRQGPGQP